jgi:uncharacterized repeat protein (TIGR01451 family)
LIQTSTGATIELVAVLTNNGPQAAQNVRLVSTLPGFLSVVQTTTSRGEVVVNGNTVSQEFAELAPGEPVELRVGARVTGAALPPGNINRIEVSSSSEDSQPANNTVSITILAPGL